MTGTAAPTTVLRLRPVVQASPLRDGIHVRGWQSSFTVKGGPGLWRLWQTLAAALAEGRPRERLVNLSERPEVRAAVATLLNQLGEHDLLVQVPAQWTADGPPPRLARWLEAVAADPAAAWDRIAGTTVAVAGAGPVAAAALRALAAARVPAHRADGAGPVVLHAGPAAVAATAGEDVGFTGPVAATTAVRAQAAAIAGRLGLDPHRPAAPGSAPPVLAALVGGAAAHRVLCAAGGLPDPGGDELAVAAQRPAATHGYPTVLVARLDPLRAEYHPWLGDGDGPAAGTGRPDLEAAQARADALCDPDLGLLAPVEVDELPQLPAGLARCPAPGGPVVGVGGTPEAARLTAVLGAAERLVAGVLAGNAGAVPVAAGADEVHATGVLLRRLVHAACGDGRGSVLPDTAWSTDPTARRWWKALTLRFAVPARLEVRAVAPGVHHCRIWSGDRLLGWAVEATAADAAAFAALAAAGAEQWRRAGGDPRTTVCVPCGATPVAPAADLDQAPWHTGAWSWPGHTADHEPDLQARLRQLAGVATTAVRPPSGRGGPVVRAVGAAFALVTVAP